MPVIDLGTGALESKEPARPGGNIIDLDTGGFVDQSSQMEAKQAQTQETTQPLEQPATQEKSLMQKAVGEVTEVIAGIDRSLLQLAEFIPATTFDAIAEIVGSDVRSYRPSKALVAEKGTFGSEFSGTVGEFAGAGAGGGALVRGAVKVIPKVAGAADSIALAAAKQLAQGTVGKEALIGAVSGAGAEAGKEAGEKIGKELGGKIGGETGGQIGMLAGSVLAPMAAGAIAPKIFSYQKITPKQQSIINELNKNPRNPNMAKFLIVDGKPKVSADLKKAAKLFGGRQGKEFVAVVKNASGPDRTAVKKMIDVIKEGRQDPIFRDDNRVGDVVGEILSRRVTALKSINKKAGQAVDQIARNELKGKTVDLTPARTAFKSQMDDLRVSYDPIKGEVDFTGSALEGSGAGASRDLIKRLAIRLKNPNIDAGDAHFIKRLIDKEVTFGKSPGGLSGEIDSSIKGLRSDVNSALRRVSEKYKQANIKYKDTIDALDNLQTAAGRTINLESPEALGTSLRRLTNNTNSRSKLSPSINEIDDTLRKYGVNFKTDIKLLNHLANSLENRFKLEGTTSLKGVGSQVAEQAKKSNFARGVEAVGFVADKATKADEEKVLNSILKILD